MKRRPETLLMRFTLRLGRWKGVRVYKLLYIVDADRVIYRREEPSFLPFLTRVEEEQFKTNRDSSVRIFRQIRDRLEECGFDVSMIEDLRPEFFDEPVEEASVVSKKPKGFLLP
jgi:hypothetical protein